MTESPVNLNRIQIRSVSSSSILHVIWRRFRLDVQMVPVAHAKGIVIKWNMKDSRAFKFSCPHVCLQCHTFHRCLPRHVRKIFVTEGHLFPRLTCTPSSRFPHYSYRHCFIRLGCFWCCTLNYFPEDQEVFQLWTRRRPLAEVSTACPGKWRETCGAHA